MRLKTFLRMFVATFAAVMLALLVAMPALAAGFSLSPAEVTFDVPADSSTNVEFLVYNFTGDLEISLENIPLTVAPAKVSVVASADGSPVELTFYGDKSLGSQVLKGKIDFLASTGGNIAFGIKVAVTVNNIVSGQPLSTTLASTTTPSSKTQTTTTKTSSSTSKSTSTTQSSSTSYSTSTTPANTTTGAANQETALNTVNLTPSSASILQNADGSISIAFPQGAAITPVEVSLENYDIGRIAPLPSGFTPASTCFHVSGLTGLLAKDAIVTVKYSADDLNKTGGPASRLKLARWDEGVSQWTILNTKVNTGAMTLTAGSNQMSIWAIVVGSSTSPSQINWAMIGTIAIVVIIIATVVILLIAPKKPKEKSAKS